MSSIAPIEAISSIIAGDLAPSIATAAAPSTQGAGGFARMLLDGVEAVDGKMIEADRLVAAFAVDDSIPLHQVTFALDQARLALDLMLTVRSSLVESYQDIMRMQL